MHLNNDIIYLIQQINKHKYNEYTKIIYNLIFTYITND